MTATVTVLADRLQTVGQRTRSTIQAIKGYRDLRDQDIAELVGWSRQKVQSYVNGPTKLTTEALAAFAYALDVPDYVLMFERDEALRWVLDNAPTAPRGPRGLETRSPGWFGRNAARNTGRRLRPLPDPLASLAAVA